MIYVMSDIHGNKERFDSILKQIHLQPTDTLYILGDVVDRYEKGIEILLSIMNEPNVKMLLGNHEYMMLRALKENRNISLWYRNGGKVTHREFLSLGLDTQKNIIKYLESLPINIDLEVNAVPYKLVHASPLESFNPFEGYANAVEYAVWNRLSHKVNCEAFIIFGHTTTNHYQTCRPMEIYRNDNMVGIDCGSGYPKNYTEGRLACLRLDDMKEYYSEIE